MHFRWQALALMLALAAGAPNATAQSGEEIGVITSVDGTWYRGTPRTPAVGPGNRLFHMDTLTIHADFTARKHVSAVLRGGRHVRFACPAQGVCRGFIPADSLGGGSRLVDGVVGLFTRELPKYAEGIVRGDPPANEAVLRLRGGALDVAPVLQGGREGTYLLRFRPLREPSESEGELPAIVSWDGVREANLPVHALVPGLYEVEVRVAGTAERPGAHAWVLLVEDGFEAREQAFRGVQQLVAGWSGATETERRAFLRATLDCLAHAASPDGSCS
jgi:hypothetical protein